MAPDGPSLCFLSSAEETVGQHFSHALTLACFHSIINQFDRSKPLTPCSKPFAIGHAVRGNLQEMAKSEQKLRRGVMKAF
jgi:hypothetical protein